LLEKVEQVWHLLQIGGNIPVISGEVDVVKLDIDDVFDFAPGGMQRACLGLYSSLRKNDGCRKNQ
jgi:hypothetical protein